MNSTYFLCLTIGAVICTGLFVWKLQRSGLKTTAALILLPLGAVLGLVASKAGYFLLELRDMLAKHEGLTGLISDSTKEFSFVCGCFGVVLAAVLAARITKQKTLPLLDAFAPCGALMAAITRACEGLLDPMALVGLGDFVENESHWFFPVAVENEMFYSWFYAVFMLEATLALLCAIGAFAISHQGRFVPGRVFLHTVVFLAVPQIFSERMLNQCMKWGFVRIEQLLCALIVFGIILYACIRYRGRGRFVPVALDLLCAGVMICIEFTLDNKPPFGIELPTTTCYVLMVLTLCCMAGLSLYSFQRLNKAAKTA